MSGEFTGTIQQHWGKAETTYDTAIAIVAGDTVDLVSLEITPDLSYEEIKAHVGTGSYQGEINGASGGKWQAVCDIAPAAAGTAPDIGFALKAALGDETVVGGTSVTYDFNDSVPESLTWTKYAGDSFYERINGAWIEQLMIEGAKGGLPKITLSGGFASYAYLHGVPTVNGAHTAPDTTIAVTAGHGYQVGVGAYVKFGAEDNGGAGYRVTDVTSAQLTITPTLAGNVSDLAVIAPLVPSHTPGGTRIGGTSHGLLIDAVAVSPISLKYTVNTGIVAFDKESSSAKPTGILRTGGRTVDLDHDIYFRHASMQYFSAAHFATQVLRDFQGRYGADTAAARMLVNTDATLVKVQGVPITDGEITTVKLMGRARQNAAANDEFSIVFS